MIYTTVYCLANNGCMKAAQTAKTTEYVCTDNARLLCLCNFYTILKILPWCNGFLYLVYKSIHICIILIQILIYKLKCTDFCNCTMPRPWNHSLNDKFKRNMGNVNIVNCIKIGCNSGQKHNQI